MHYLVKNWLFIIMYNTALVMMLAPQNVNENEKERSGILMNFHLMGGICFGTLIAAFGMKEIPKYSNY